MGLAWLASPSLIQHLQIQALIGTSVPLLVRASRELGMTLFIAL